MNTRRNAARSLEVEISNAGVPPHGSLVPPLEIDVNDDQDPVDPPLMDGAIRYAFFQMPRSITTQAQAATTQAQAMTVEDNWEVIPRATQQVITMPSRLRDFTRMNSPYFLWVQG
ncbi:hypothetical protein EJD97_005261 [Solanum chilense]|uniref:Uncharacterized protein n=1 Tax=Solanum chilense TaxID=4083 RepID=A0A6N2AK92_SOLCI|nr:hypothetical protein EJD97_005261 [Solanum chilense]